MGDIPTIIDEAGFDKVLDAVCKDCEWRTQTRDCLPYLGCEEECPEVKKELEKRMIIGVISGRLKITLGPA